MKSRKLFESISVASLVMSHVVWQLHLRSGVDVRSLLVLAVIYAICYVVRNRTYDDKTTFFDIDSRALPAEDDGLIIFGERVEDLSHESRERRLLTSLVDFTGQKYKLYFAWFASSVVVLYLQFRFTQTVSIDMLASFAIVAAIYFAPFLNQLLAPLFIAFAMALYGFVESSQLRVAICFAIFLALFAFAVVIFREVARDRINPVRKFSPKNRIRTALLLASAAIFIYGIIDYVVPQENPFHANPNGVVVPPKNQPRLSTDRISRELAEQVVKLGERHQDAKIGPAGREAGQPDQGSTGTGDRAGEPGESSPGRSVGDRGARGAGGTEKNGPTAGAHRGADPASGSGAETGAGSGRRGSDGDGSSKTPGGTGSAAGPGADGTKDSGRNGTPQAARDAAGDRPAGEKRGTGAAGEGGDSRPGSPSSGAAGSPERAAGPSGATTTTESQQNPQKQHEKKVEEVQKDITLPIDLAKGVIFLAFAAALVFTLFRYFSKKKPEEEVVRQQLSPKQRQKLETLLQRIKARGLSPNDEIVETYNLLLTVFELGNHPREEWLPAEDFSNQISNSIPVLKTPFSSATERFSQTLYGRRNVDEAQLAKFRREVSKILQFFQLS